MMLDYDDEPEVEFLGIPYTIVAAICPSGECLFGGFMTEPHTLEEYKDCMWLADAMMNSGRQGDYVVSDWAADRNWADSRWPNEY